MSQNMSGLGGISCELHGCDVNTAYMTEASPCPVDEEPEEDLTLEQVKERAEAGDARAQTRVSENACTRLATRHCCQASSLTQSGCTRSISGSEEDDPCLLI